MAISVGFRAWFSSHQRRLAQWMMQRSASARTIRPHVPASLGRSTPMQHSLRASRARRNVLAVGDALAQSPQYPSVFRAELIDEPHVATSSLPELAYCYWFCNPNTFITSSPR